jgi:hypothetical protein
MGRCLGVSLIDEAELPWKDQGVAEEADDHYPIILVKTQFLCLLRGAEIVPEILSRTCVPSHRILCFSPFSPPHPERNGVSACRTSFKTSRVVPSLI